MTGQKYSEGKLPIGKVLLKQFPKAFQEVVRNSNTGHQKYILTDSKWDNWKHVKGGKETYIDAALRHLIQAENEVWDKDTEPYGGSRHLAAVAWNILAALELDLIEEELIQKREELQKDMRTTMNNIIASDNYGYSEPPRLSVEKLTGKITSMGYIHPDE